MAAFGGIFHAKVHATKIDRKTMTLQHDQDFSLREDVVDRQLITTFVHVAENGSRYADRGGNPCMLVMREKAPKESSQPTTGLTVCYSWPSRSGPSTVISVICYTSDDRAIQCCGHGLLAAAYGWLQRLQLNEVSLLMNGSQIPGWRAGQTTWLRFKRLPTMHSAVPNWVEEVFANQPQPVAAAVCGDEQGYQVLQWPDNFDLGQLADSAVYCHTANPCLAGQLGYVAVDLLCQFAGRSDDKSADLLAALAFDHTLQDGQNKGCGLAGTGLGQAHDITSFQDCGNRLFLDWGGCFIIAGPNTCINCRVKIKLFKTHFISLYVFMWQSRSPSVPTINRHRLRNGNKRFCHWSFTILIPDDKYVIFFWINRESQIADTNVNSLEISAVQFK